MAIPPTCSEREIHRTSGTEPKIKYYLEGSASDRELVGKLLEAVVQQLKAEWMEVDKNGLEMP